MTLQEIKKTLRNGPYAWPGGYPLYFLDHYGEPLSFAAVRKNWPHVVRAHLTGEAHDGWLLDAVCVNWEEPDLHCAETGQRIESAYGEED